MFDPKKVKVIHSRSIRERMREKRYNLMDMIVAMICGIIGTHVWLYISNFLANL